MGDGSEDSPESDDEGEVDEADASDADAESAGAMDITSNKRNEAAAFEIDPDIDIKLKALLDMLVVEPLNACPGVPATTPSQDTCSRCEEAPDWDW